MEKDQEATDDTADHYGGLIMIEQATDQFIEAIKQTAEYREYMIQKEKR